MVEPCAKGAFAPVIGWEALQSGDKALLRQVEGVIGLAHLTPYIGVKCIIVRPHKGIGCPAIPMAQDSPYPLLLLIAGQRVHIPSVYIFAAQDQIVSKNLKLTIKIII